MYKQGNLYNKDNTEYCGANQFAWNVLETLNFLSENRTLSARISDLEKTDKVQRILQSSKFNMFKVDDIIAEKEHQPTGGEIFYNPS